MNKQIELRISNAGPREKALITSLRGLPGIEDANINNMWLRVVYDPIQTDTGTIIDVINSSDAQVVTGFFQRILLWLRCYREAIIEEESDNDSGWDSFVREIYVSRYRHRRHGRRDDRARHWRQYSRQRK
ncbi:MAG: hypothetical protein O3C28_12705 [Proteobacteria bacterium]|nr:hypothetical protein [Pseudomonadota bacterium]